MSTTQKRFQIDLTEEELKSIDRLGALAGLRTKKDVVLNALTLFKWAARETMAGRTVCSIRESSNMIRQLELPALSAIAEASPKEMTTEELRESLSGPSLPRGSFAPQGKGVGNVSSVLEESSRSGLDRGMESGASV
jgi:hypothetical protein